MPVTTIKHVCLYLNTFYNGGIERVMLNLAKAMVDRGVRVDIVVNFVDYSPMWSEVPDTIRLVDLNANHLQRFHRLKRYLRTERPEAILSATHVSNELAALAARSAKTGVRVIASEHTSLSTELRREGNLIRRIGIPLLGRMAYRHTHTVVGVSEGVRKDAEKLFSLPVGKSRTIYNPIDPDKIRTLASEPVEHPWFQDGGKPIVLGIGRLEEQKDFTSLLTAFARVRRTSDARLAILGEGAQRDMLTAMVRKLGLQDDVWIAGFIANPYPYFSRASVFALSSAWEGLPTTLIEALILGVPIVSTDCPSGPSEILDGGVYGRLVPVRAPIVLAHGIEQALHGFVTAAPPSSYARYSVDAVVEQYFAVMG